jgi:signal transduction histidine kinase
MAGQNTEIYIAVITVIAALVFILCLFIGFIVITQRRVIALQKKSLKAEILSMEKERERVASDLHDSLGSTLSAMSLLNKQILTADEESTRVRDHLEEYIEETKLLVKQIAKNIIPRFHEDTTVEQVVERAVGDFRIICLEKGVNFTVNNKAEIVLSKEKHLHLYRIVKEILNNACKHSQAQKITLTCLYANSVLVLAFNDDGVGYSVNNTYDGLGLSNIQNRVSLLEGHYHVQSEKGMGTEVMIRIPVKDE